MLMWRQFSVKIIILCLSATMSVQCARSCSSFWHLQFPQFAIDKLIQLELTVNRRHHTDSHRISLIRFPIGNRRMMSVLLCACKIGGSLKCHRKNNFILLSNCKQSKTIYGFCVCVCMQLTPQTMMRKTWMSHDFINTFVSHSIYLRIGCNGGETIDFSSILSFKCSTILHKFTSET